MAIGNIKGITIEIGGDATKLEKSLSDVYKKSRELTSEVKEIDKAMRFNPKNVELVAQKQKALADQVKNTRERLNELKSAQEQVNEQFRKGEISEEQYRAFRREIIETESILKNYEKKLSEVTDKHKILGKSMEEFGGKMSKVGDKMKTVGKDLTMKVTAPLVGIGGLAIKTGADFERGMSEVQSVSGATAEEMKTLEDAARFVGRETNKSARDAADALKYLGMAGWDVEDSQKALLPLVKLSTAGNIELGRASDLVTDSMSTMGIEVDDLERYLDVLANTSTMTNTDIDGLAEAFITVGGRLRTLNVDFEEGASALAVLAKNGIKGSEAGTGLNAVLANLTAPTGRAKKALEDLGVSAFDINGDFIGIEETLQLVKDATSGMTQEQENMYLSMIGGKEHTATLSALMQGLEGDFDNFKNGVQESNGSLDEMYDVMTDNLQGSMDILMSTISDVAIGFYDMANGPLKTFIDKITQAVEWFGNLDEGTQQTILMVGGFAAALGPVIWALGTTISSMGTIVSAGGKLIGSFGSIGSAGGALASGLSSTIGFLFSPAGAILVGIAAVVAGGVWLYKNWDTVKEKAGQLKEWVSTKWTELSTATSQKFQEVKNAAVNKIEETKQGVVNKATEMKNNFVNKATEIKNSTVGKFNELKSGVTTSIGNTVDSVRNRFSAAYDAIMSPINRAKDGVRNAIDRMKSFFNFSWSLPRIKLPHFSISGKFSLNPPSIPSFGVNWYADGAILTRPTLFGAMGNQMMAGGEYRTGGEAILPLNRLPQMMAEAMQAAGMQNQATTIVQVYLGEDEITDWVTEQVNVKLRKQSGRERRGRRP